MQRQETLPLRRAPSGERGGRSCWSWLATVILDARTRARAEPQAGCSQHWALAGSREVVGMSPSPVLEEGNWSSTARASHSSSGTTNVASANGDGARDPFRSLHPLNPGPRDAAGGSSWDPVQCSAPPGRVASRCLGAYRVLQYGGPQEPSSWRAPSSPSLPASHHALPHDTQPSRGAFINTTPRTVPPWGREVLPHSPAALPDCSPLSHETSGGTRGVNDYPAPADEAMFANRSESRRRRWPSRSA